jgi:hypothetical protein
MKSEQSSGSIEKKGPYVLDTSFWKVLVPDILLMPTSKGMLHMEHTHMHFLGTNGWVCQDLYRPFQKEKN